MRRSHREITEGKYLCSDLQHHSTGSILDPGIRVTRVLPELISEHKTRCKIRAHPGMTQ